MNQERRKIEFLTEAMSGLRGLPLILFGLAQIILMTFNYLAELASQKRNYAGKDITYTMIIFLICLVGSLFLIPRVRKHFGDKFGRTTPKPLTFSARLQGWLSITPFIFGFLVGSWLDSTYQLSFSVTVLSIAISTFIIWFATYRGISNVTLGGSLILLIFSFLPWENIFQIITVLDNYSARNVFYHTICLIFYGISCIVMGFDDLRLLSSMVKTIEREDGYESV